MARFSSPLNRIKIAAPCNADWDQMIGNDRVRFCGQCQLNVYNLSSMTRIEAESFIARKEGRLCVRFYQRADGSVLTKNCPIGLLVIRQRLSYVSKAVISIVLGFFAGIGVFKSFSMPKPIRMGMLVREQPLREEVPAVTFASVTGQLVEPAWRMGDKMEAPSHRRKASNAR